MSQSSAVMILSDSDNTDIQFTELLYLLMLGYCKFVNVNLDYVVQIYTICFFNHSSKFRFLFINRMLFASMKNRIS